MKRFQLASRIFAPEIAAATLRLDAVVKALLSLGNRVDVYTTTYAGAKSEWRPGLTVSRWPAKRDAEGYLRGYLPYMSFDLPLFWRLLFAPSADAVLVEPPPTTGVVVRLVCALRRRPYLYYAADIWSRAVAGSAPALVTAALKAIERFALSGAAGIVAVNADVAALCKELGGKNIRVVEQGVDTELFSFAGATPSPLQRAELGLGNRPYLIYAGNASEVHGAEILLEAYSRIVDEVDFDLVFFGRGTSWQDLTERANSPALSGRVHVNGLLPPEELATWLRGASGALASIHPQSGYELAYTTKALSAFSCGVPLCYVGEGPTARDIRENRLGVVSRYEAAALARGMAELATTAWDRSAIRSWAEENKSIVSSGLKVAQELVAVSERK